MFKKLRKKIESKRNSRTPFWKSLVISKDIAWKITKQPLSIITNPINYILCSYNIVKNREIFRNIKTYCMFIGYPRSGHSLIGSLLDAHPNIAIAHELNTLEFIKSGFTKNRIYSLILKNSKEFTKKGRKWNGYSYIVPGQCHNKFKKLLVIGDKKGDLSSQLIRSNPKILKKLKKTMGRTNIKMIHVIRNPYDNIATISKNLNLQKAIDFYFYNVEAVLKTKNKINKEDILDVWHESFIRNPKQNLKRICKFLGVESPDDYLIDCAKIVWKKPHKTRYDVNWTPELINSVNERLSRCEFLKKYSYTK